MPPRPLARVVIDRQRHIAVRAGEPGPARMLNPHVHPAVGYRQLDPPHLPRSPQSQQMAVQLGVAHAANPAADRPSNPSRTHTEAGRVPCFPAGDATRA